ncbi:hypothetical protein ACQEWB_22280 [Streptomyces sp. CA-249302]|uniref:hypothetical protein n=1 Tax=Streptomyces sp. CA-249302 TaxID=3240058 RepID=UPI003D91883C
MPFDEVNDPKRVQGIWFGGPMSDNAKQGLRELTERFPESERVLWVMPRTRPGAAGQEAARALMDEYQQEATASGFKVRNAFDEAEWLTENLDSKKYNAETLRDVYRMEMSNQGYIAAKDLTAFMVGSKETSLTVDLSNRHMRDTEMEAVRGDGRYDVKATDPFGYNEAELKIVDLSYGDDALQRHVMQTDFERTSEKFYDAGIEPQLYPHLDVFAMYSREGTRGQEVMTASAEAYFSQLSQIAMNGQKNGYVQFQDNSDPQGFKPESIKLERPLNENYGTENDNWLGAKYNTLDQDRDRVIGQMAIHSLTDGIYQVYGQPEYEASPDKPMPGRVVAPETWNDITMRAYDVDGVKVLPQISLTKDAQNSWRGRDLPENPQNLHERSEANAQGVRESKLRGEKLTLVQATHLGVDRARERGLDTALQNPGRIRFEIRQPVSADQSPVTTPPRTASPDLNQLTADVAAIPILNAPNVLNANAVTPVPPRPTETARSNSAPVANHRK